MSLLVRNMIAFFMLTVFACLSGCSRYAPGPHHNGNDEGEALSSLSFLFSPEQAKNSSIPNVYELQLSYLEDEHGTIFRRGELPKGGGLLEVLNLPAGDQVEVKAKLFLNSFTPNAVTHSCKSSEPVNLQVDETVSVQLECFAITSVGKEKPVKILYKVAKLTGKLDYVDVNSLIMERSWNEPTLFVGWHSRGIRVSVKSWGNRLKVYIGGRFQFISDVFGDFREVISSKDSLTLYRDGGSLVDVAPEKVQMQILEPTFYEDAENKLKVALPIQITGSEEFEVSGTLFEKPWQSEFTLASYNVENLFDQLDVERNAHYGDFRIEANERGQYSNWGEPVIYEGSSIDFTTAKIESIVKVLTAIEPTGPSYINLQEIESKQALKQLFERVRPLGYVAYAFTDWAEGKETAVGLGVLAKFPIRDVRLLYPQKPSGHEDEYKGNLRPIMRIEVEPVPGHKMTVYNNHWASKGNPESFRKEFAKVLAADIEDLLKKDPKADYVVTGDLNCNYNEKVTLEDQHNDTDGETGINHVLNTQGEELDIAKGLLNAKYNLHYELPFEQRKTAWYSAFGWSSFDQMVVGKTAYDQRNFTYVDNSFSVASAKSKSFGFIFDQDAHPIRWIQKRLSKQYTEHKLGGYSDHVPISARFYISDEQSDEPIWLVNPGHSDLRDQSK